MINTEIQFSDSIAIEFFNSLSKDDLINSLLYKSDKPRVFYVDSNYINISDFSVNIKNDDKRIDHALIIGVHKNNKYILVAPSNGYDWDSGEPDKINNVEFDIVFKNSFGQEIII